MRDWFADLNKQSFTIHREDDRYVIKNSQSGFTYITKTLHTAKPFFDFLMELTSKGWTITRTDSQYTLKKDALIYTVEELSDKKYHLKTQGLELFGPREILYVILLECEEGLYTYDYSGKTVLDIGGFCGETAAYFSSTNAKKVIVYEPCRDHYPYIKTNAELNNVNIELHEAGIGDTDGTLTVNYGEGGLSFNRDEAGQNQTTINIENVANAIMQSKADVAKIDCEGAEMSLTKLAPEILQLIPYYFIETHSEEIEKAVTAKFLASGFKVTREPIYLTEGISMNYFEKV